MTGDEAEHVQTLETVVDFVRGDRRRRLRAGHRQRPRHVQDRAAPRLASASPTSWRPPASRSRSTAARACRAEQFTDLIARGCAKVNISTALKIAFMKSGYDFMTENPGKYDPPSIFKVQRAAVKDDGRGPHPHVRQRRQGLVAPMSTLIFDCDGVLADTERYGHLPSFNQTFEEFGLPFRWSEEEYGRKLAIGGGKERMTLHADARGHPRRRPAGRPGGASPPRSRSGTSARPRIYTEMVAAGKLPPRPGIRRLIAEAQDAGWTLAVASTSAEPAVRAILELRRGPGAGRPVRPAARRRRRPQEEARSRRSTCSPSSGWPSRRPTCSWSRTPATACSPPSAPACAA